MGAKILGGLFLFGSFAGGCKLWTDGKKTAAAICIIFGLIISVLLFVVGSS